MRSTHVLVCSALILPLAGCAANLDTGDGLAPEHVAEAAAALSDVSKLIDVNVAGCNTNVAINDAIAQSFQVQRATTLDHFDIWMASEPFYTTSYDVELYDGEGTGGTRLATSSSLSLSPAAASTWYSFAFAGGVTLQANHAYTLKVVRLSTYSGTFAQCGNVYPYGIEYWLGNSADSYHDMAFRLFGTSAAWDFGGAFGYVGGGLVPNPSTGAASCPAGYTGTQVLSTAYVDWPVSFCARTHQDGVDPLYDFGGMYGYVNGAPAPNPITGAASCPAGYTDQEVLGAANCDPYPLHVCYAPHTAGRTSPYGFGGMYGYVNGVQVPNPVTGAASCPAGYTDTQALGTNGADYPLHFCWVSSYVPPSDFGGAFGYVGGGLVPNPSTGAASCPAGYTGTQVLSTAYVDWPVSFCARPHHAGVDPLYDFGGMYGYVNGVQVPNPITGAASCPTGYTAQEVLGAANCDPYPLYVCYAPHTAGTPSPYAFGGMWGYVNGAPTANPLTAAASCPAAYNDTQVLGTNGADYPLHFCWY